MPDGAAVLSRVLDATRRDVEAARSARNEKNARLTAAGKKIITFKPELSFAIYFAKSIGQEMAAALRPDFPEVRSGETPSESVRGPKRVDLNYSTPEAGLGFAVSFKSVHFGEKENGDASFTHDLKRNDEELGFYEVGGAAKCPRTGRPAQLLSLADFVRRLKVTYDRRNGRDFFFEGEEPGT
jgi:hypothetical protein